MKTLILSLCVCFISVSVASAKNQPVTLAEGQPPQKAWVAIFTAKPIHPEDPVLIKPMAEQLAAKSIGVVSVELPTNPAQQSEVIANTLKLVESQQGAGYLLCYAAHCQPIINAAQNNSSKIKGVILLSVFAFEKNKALLPALKNIRMFDIVAQHDYINVKNAFLQRQTVLDANKHYKSQEILGADHRFESFQGLLAKKIKGWMFSKQSA